MHPGATLLQLLQLLSYGLFFFLMLQAAANRARARRIGLALFFIVTAHALYGLAALVLFGDTLLFFEKWAYPGFATGGFVNRNSFATFLAFGLVLGTIFFLREQLGRGHDSKALIYLALSGLILAALLATGSRMGLFAGLVGAACAALMAIQKAAEAKARRKLLLLAALPLAAALLVAIIFGTGTLDRLGSLENDANVRGDLYAQVLSMIAARPWLGYGGGAFEFAYPLFHQWPVSPDLVWDKAHSTYLALWAELGVVAGSLPLLIVAVFTLQALRLYAARSADWAAPAIAVAVVAVAAVHSLVDFSLEIEANAFLFLAILALAIARPKPVQRPETPAGGA
jgi:O-antigen ligase